LKKHINRWQLWFDFWSRFDDNHCSEVHEKTLYRC